MSIKYTPDSVAVAREFVRAALIAADNANHSGEVLILKMAAATLLFSALASAQRVIDETREDLHQRRVADWYPEGAHNAAEQMSEDMRLIGNRLADIDFLATLDFAEGRS